MAAAPDPLVALFRETISSSRERHLALLKELCDIESGSEMVDGVNRVGQRIAQELEALGLNVSRHPADGFGNHIVASTGAPGRQIVLGGHLDTTYLDYGELPKTHEKGDVLIGPGTADMRGGLIVILAALQCLEAAVRLKGLPITVIFNSDEERGAVTSRDLFLKHRRDCKAALFFECAGANNEFVVSRRAKLSYRLDAKGVGKHAGAMNTDKVSALVALSHAVIATEQLNGCFEGTSFNVGRAWGGIASNTVPEDASALIDIRYLAADQEQPIRDAMEALCESVSEAAGGARVTLKETSFRPAWEQSARNAALSRLVQNVAEELGQQADEECRGGTADSNWFGAAGVPCIDGLGPIGFDDHTPAEHLVIESLFERALLVSKLLVSLDAFDGGEGGEARG